MAKIPSFTKTLSGALLIATTMALAGCGSDQTVTRTTTTERTTTTAPVGDTSSTTTTTTRQVNQ